MQAHCFAEETHDLPREKGRQTAPYTELGQPWVDLQLHDAGECETVQALLAAAKESSLSAADRNVLARVCRSSAAPVFLKASAPFSALMQLARSDRVFVWLGRYPQQMHDALRWMTDATQRACAEASACGVRVVSLADPCAMPALLGKKRFRAFAADYVAAALRQLLPALDGAAIHLCPRLSLALEQLGYLSAEPAALGEGIYAQAIARQAAAGTHRLWGHHCIHDPREGRIEGYALRLQV